MRYQALILAAVAAASLTALAQESSEPPRAAARNPAAERAAGTDKSRIVTPRTPPLPAVTPQGESGSDGGVDGGPPADVRSEARAEDPRISDLDVEISGEQVLLSFRLVNAFDDNLKKRIDSGLYSGFLFEFELVRDRKTWFNKNLDSSTLQVVAMYNAITREYLINVRRDGDLIGSRVVQDVADLERALTEFDDLAMLSIEGVNPQQRLRVRVRAELGTRTVFFFIPNTVHTDWAESERFRLAEFR